MSRRAARFTQAELARALRAVEALGHGWRVEIEAGVIRLVPPSEPLQEPEPKPNVADRYQVDL